MLPVILLFGIYGGVMTPTEGAAAAAFYALLASTVLYRAVTWKQLYEAILTSGRATTSIGMLIAGALVFNYVVTIENVPASLAQAAGRISPVGGRLPARHQHPAPDPWLPARRQHDPARHRPDLHSDRQGARDRSRPFRCRRGRQHHDRAADAALWPVAVRTRQHDQAAAGRDRARGRAIHCCCPRWCLLAISLFPDTILWLPRLMGYKG